MPSETNIAARLDTAMTKGVIPYFSLAGRVDEAVAFYARAFGAREFGRMPMEDDPGKVMHCQLEINGGALMMTDMTMDGSGAFQSGGAFNLTLVVDDGDAWWDRAVAAGCEVAMPFERQFWGDRYGQLRDPFGLIWAINEEAKGGPAS